MWNAIMQVGKTPMITQNMILPPYTSIGEEITQNAVISLISGAGNSGGILGGLVDVNFVGTPFTCNFGSSGDLVEFRIDMRRNFILRAIVATFWMGFGGEGGTMTFLGSRDGLTWDVLETFPFDAGNDNTITINDKELRYLQVRMLSTGGGGTSSIVWDKIRIFLDSTQYTY